MKAPPKRKGNTAIQSGTLQRLALNESPSEKEGKFLSPRQVLNKESLTLNESPSEKEGKSKNFPPRVARLVSLNESPSEKEGKWFRPGVAG